MSAVRFHALGDFALESGAVLANAALAFVTDGDLNAARDNAVLVPSYYSGTHASYTKWIGPGRVLDPAKYFVVRTNLLGNGLSTSPSHDDGSFPLVSIGDNVRAQFDLLSRELGISRIALAVGWSLGAMQSLHWAMLYPDMVARVMAVCGTSYCWPLNIVFLAGLAPILEAAGKLGEDAALKMFGRSYAGWAYSAAFFREGLYRDLGFSDVEALLRWWEQDHLEHRAADLLAVLNTWRAAAVPAPELRAAALQRIQAQCLLMPSTTDVYFTVEEATLEAACIPRAQLVPLVSPYGHCAGAPGRFPAETQLIEAQMRRLLSL
jgi:homoserine O-acetyltransferase